MPSGRNITVSETSRPKLPRHAKLKFDETRQVWVILAPERVLAPDEIAIDVGRNHAKSRERFGYPSHWGLWAVPSKLLPVL